MTEIPPKLPISAEDGDEVMDRNGAIWRFEVESDTWVYRGSLGAPPIVSESEAGLITPDIDQQLQKLREVRSSGVSFEILKIYPALEHYWYYLLSTNKTIRFTPESESDLRIEVNKARILQLLSQMKCPGPIGAQGVAGISGKDGSSSVAEIVHEPVVFGNTMEIDAQVESSIGTPMSLRIFKDSEALPSLTIRVPLDVGSIVVEQVIYGIYVNQEQTSLSYEVTSGRLVGKLVITDDWDDESEWTYKASQKGRQGARGQDGGNFLQIVPKQFSDDVLRSKEAIISLRQGGTHGDMYYFSSTLFDGNCVSKISFNNICQETIILFDLCLVAVQMTTEQCKNIQRFCFLPGASSHGTYPGGGRNFDGKYVEIGIPPLILPDWTPVAACWRQRHWPISQFRWSDLTEVSRDNIGWQTANERFSRDPAFPWGVNDPKPPGDRCCQEDFFFCPNINDEPCGVKDTDGGVPDIVRPASPQLCCECDCPIALDVQDGYDFDEIGISADQTVFVGVARLNEYDAPCQNITCTLDGSIHEYRLRVVVEETRSPISVTLNFKVGYDDLCDEARNAFWDDQKKNTNVIPAFTLDCGEAVSYENCPFEWSVRDASSTGAPDGLALMERQGPDYSVAIQDEVVSMTFEGQSGVIDVSILVNLQRVSCCLAYGLEVCLDHVNRTFASRSPSPSPSISPSFIPSISPLPPSPSPPPPPSPSPPPPPPTPSPSNPPPPSSPAPSPSTLLPSDMEHNDGCNTRCDEEVYGETDFFVIELIGMKGDCEDLDGIYHTQDEKRINIVNGNPVTSCHSVGTPVLIGTTVSPSGWAMLTVQSGWYGDPPHLLVFLMPCDELGNLRPGQYIAAWKVPFENGVIESCSAIQSGGAFPTAGGPAGGIYGDPVTSGPCDYSGSTVIVRGIW